MKTYTTIKTLVFSAIVAATFTSCVKDDDWNTPEILCNNRFDAPTTTMAQFVALAPPRANAADFSATTYKVPADGSPVIFDAYVVSSDESGNFYKTISFQDKAENPTVGLQMEVDKASNYADFPVGAHIRIKANGLVLGLDRGTIKIGSVDPAYAIGRIPSILLTRYLAGVCAGDNRLDVATMVPTKLPNLDTAKNEKYINTLVQVSDVQFDEVLISPTPKSFIEYVAGVGQDTDRTIFGKNGNSTIIRNSGFSTFGATLLPTKSGDITFVVSRYNGAFQMLIRGLKDINFNNERFLPGAPDNPSASAVNLFAGADFENWTTFLSSVNNFGLKTYATQGVGLGYNGTNSLQIKGTPTANDYVFTSVATSGLPAKPKRITMYIKGTATGKSLSFNVYKTSGTPAYYTYNLGTFATGAILSAADANAYNGSINTNGQWRLIEINVSSLTDMNLTAGKDIFAIKTGTNGVYDLQIDNITIE